MYTVTYYGDMNFGVMTEDGHWYFAKVLGIFFDCCCEVESTFCEDGLPVRKSNTASGMPYILLWYACAGHIVDTYCWCNTLQGGPPANIACI